jgi:predicted alpha/beta hydrolase
MTTRRMTLTRQLLSPNAADGARVRLQLHLPPRPRAALYWLPALGVGIGPNERFADALAERGVAVAIHEWRGLGGSDRRASRRCDWGYRELLELDLAAGRQALRAALPDLQWLTGGHSLGGQLALIDTARRGDDAPVLLVASGHPYWREFPGLRAAGVRLFAHAIRPLTALCGHFPGERLGFAGREASTLMRDWAGTALRGDYAVEPFGPALDEAVSRYRGRALAICMAQDTLAPPAAIGRLRAMAARAEWTLREFGHAELGARRPDHFGWLREPAAVAQACVDWLPVAA